MTDWDNLTAKEQAAAEVGFQMGVEYGREISRDGNPTGLTPPQQDALLKALRYARINSTTKG